MDSNQVGFTNEQITQFEDISLNELLVDAQEAQTALREMLASTACWEPLITKTPKAKEEAGIEASPPAVQEKDDVPRGPAFAALQKKVAELPSQDGSTRLGYKLSGDKEGAVVKHAGLVSATCRVYTRDEVEAHVIAIERPHHGTPPYHAIVDAIKLDIVYDSASKLLAALQEVLACKAFTVATVDNLFHHPLAMGHACVLVRVKVPVKGGREHVATIRLLLKELEDLLEAGIPDLEDRIDSVLVTCAERSRITLTQQQALHRWILQLLDRTEGIELSELEYTRKELARAEAAQERAGASDLILKDRTACLRKYIAALERRQFTRDDQRADDLKVRQEVAERSRRFKAPVEKEVPFGNHNPRLHKELDDRLLGMWDTWSSWPTRGQAGRTCDAVRISRLAQPRVDRSIHAKPLPVRKEEVGPPSLPRSQFRPRSPRTVSTTWCGSAKRTNPRKILGTLPRSDQTSWMSHLCPDSELMSTTKSLKASRSPRSKELSEQPSSP
jgi:hypothetical protein